MREELPELEGRIDVAVGKSYGGNIALSPRVLTQLGVEGHVTRGRNGGHWRISRPQWTSMAAWLGDVPEPWTAAEGWAELVRRWLWTFGPGTAADVQWWLGRHGRASSSRPWPTLGAEPVSLDDGETGWLLPDDLDAVAFDEPWAALLPVLDPTVMGWKSRGFYLHPEHVPHLFDSNGNAGTTAWVDGRIVGCWVQDDAGVVEVRYVDAGAEGRRRRPSPCEAERLTAWLDGVRVGTVYPSAAMKGVTARAIWSRACRADERDETISNLTEELHRVRAELRRGARRGREVRGAAWPRSAAARNRAEKSAACSPRRWPSGCASTGPTRSRQARLLARRQ